MSFTLRIQLISSWEPLQHVAQALFVGCRMDSCDLSWMVVGRLPCSRAASRPLLGKLCSLSAPWVGSWSSVSGVLLPVGPLYVGCWAAWAACRLLTVSTLERAGEVCGLPGCCTQRQPHSFRVTSVQSAVSHAGLLKGWEHPDSLSCFVLLTHIKPKMYYGCVTFLCEQ